MGVRKVNGLTSFTNGVKYSMFISLVQTFVVNEKAEPFTIKKNPNQVDVVSAFFLTRILTIVSST